VAGTRWGILSTARINLAVLEGARKSNAVEVVAVGSRDTARADAYAREHSIPRAQGSYEALLADDDVDAVYISLPNSLHHEWTMRALASGKHVLCEKPYSRRAAEVEEAFDAAERAGLVLSEAFMWRHNPQTRRLVELLPEIGELRGVRSTHAFVLTDETNVRLRPELDGGGLMDVGCYSVSAARLLAGEPERVYGEQVVGPTGVDVHFTGTLRFAGDVIAEFVCGFDFSHRELEVLGTEGTLKTLDPFTFSKGGVYLDGEELPVEPEDPYKLELENVSAAAKGEAPLLLGREDALGQARTIEALYESAEEGRPIDL
jgi:D-xylose 1-dehydrogenase (NADP+, D-xylono-1,5-lactone-forming)